RVADDPADRYAVEHALDVPHLGVDGVVPFRELALRLTAREHAAGAMVDGARGAVCAVERVEDCGAVEHRAGHEARMSRLGPARAPEVGVPGGKRARRAFPMHEARLRRA